MHRAAGVRRRRAPAAPPARGPRGGHLARRREVGARAARRRRRARRDRAHRGRVRHPLSRRGLGRRAHDPRGDGEPDRRTSSTPTIARSRSCTGSRSRRERHARARAAVPGRAADDRRRVPVERLAQWYRRFVETRSSDAAERALETALVDADRARRCRSDDVRRRHRPRVHRRRAHDRLHEQGVRGARVPRRGRRRSRAPDARAPNRRRAALGGVLRVAPPARPRRPRERDDRSPSRRGRRRRRAAGGYRRRRRRGARLAVPRRRSVRRCRRAARRAARRDAAPNSSVGRSRTQLRCASPASTSRTTTPTGTPSTIRSRAPTPCTTRCSAARHPSCCAVAYTPRCGSTSTGSSTSPRPGCRRAKNGDLDTLAQCFEIQGGVDDAGNEAYGFLVAGGPRAELIAHARPRAARRGRRLPLVPDGRGRRPSGRSGGPRGRRSRR